MSVETFSLKRDTLAAQLREKEHLKAQYLAHIRDNKSRLQKFTQSITLLSFLTEHWDMPLTLSNDNETIAEYTPTELLRTVVGTTDHARLIERKGTFRNRITEAKEDIEINTRRLRGLQKEIRTLKAEVEKTNSVDGVSKEQLVEMLKSHPLVKTDSITLAPHMITWVITGAKATVDNNIYQFICEGEQVSIPVADTRVIISSNPERSFTPESDLQLIPEDPDSPDLEYYYSNSHPVVHPHVLGDHHPCLGSFYTPLCDMAKVHDFALVTDILVGFLSQINSGDAAGERWIRYFAKRVWGQNTILPSYAGREFYKGLRITEVGNDGNATTETQPPKTIIANTNTETPIQIFENDELSIVISQSGKVLEIHDPAYIRCQNVEIQVHDTDTESEDFKWPERLDFNTRVSVDEEGDPDDGGEVTRPRHEFHPSTRSWDTTHNEHAISLSLNFQ